MTIQQLKTECERLLSMMWTEGEMESALVASLEEQCMWEGM